VAQFDSDNFGTSHLAVEIFDDANKFIRKPVRKKDNADLALRDVRVDLIPKCIKKRCRECGVFGFDFRVRRATRFKKLCDLCRGFEVFRLTARLEQLSNAARGPVLGAIRGVVQHLTYDFSPCASVFAALDFDEGRPRVLIDEEMVERLSRPAHRAIFDTDLSRDQQKLTRRIRIDLIARKERWFTGE
jgi:hypothetical protein